MAPLPQTRLEASLYAFTHVGVDYAGPIVVSVRRKTEKRYICLPDHPQTRLEAYSPPFTHVGVDYAGPIVVSVRRKTEKRYICLFTCLTTRAVHLELSYSLDTDSFLMAFRRFTNRRGVPSTVYSDNATNFVAGRKETQRGLQLWNQQKINDEMIQRRIRWVFSPPGAPHFGGIWERMIRTAKDALLRVLNGRAVSDEVLLTALSWVVDPFCNVEEPETELQEELAELQNNEELKPKFTSGYHQFWLQRQVAQLYPRLWAVVEKLFVAFPSSYLAERGFIAVTDLLSKKRNRLQIVKRGDLRTMLTNISPDVKKLVSLHQAHPSH
ncbi:hypothetical protein M513_12271 [Trichuris suis]|uniref:Integrase catalytic domain-containing protein n=1 Tax=Trichuris suis TaxID=68888 RepID=A0A085LPH0_9BILA|nr:hypothetical protein M513_12271 [Trichuris suis]